MGGVLWRGETRADKPHSHLRHRRRKRDGGRLYAATAQPQRPHRTQHSPLPGRRHAAGDDRRPGQHNDHPNGSAGSHRVRHERNGSDDFNQLRRCARPALRHHGRHGQHQLLPLRPTRPQSGRMGYRYPARRVHLR